MKNEFPVEKTIKGRRSIRTYEDRPLSTEKKEEIRAYISALTNPFAVNVSIRLLETKEAVHEKKLGTYGVIKGAGDFIGASVVPGELALEGLGYSFEKLVLYMTSLGLGTCWLGGTFNRGAFAQAMEVKENELFPVISPVGYPLEEKRLGDSLVRWVAKSDRRLDWEKLFFTGDFSHPLTEADAGILAFPLEMVRLAPSAANKQPWRILREEKALHFYEAKTIRDNKLDIDIQRVDVGIAACHFHLAIMEKEMRGRFEKLPTPAAQTPESLHYLFSWIFE